MINMVKHTSTDSTYTLVDSKDKVLYVLLGYIPVVGSMFNVHTPTAIPCTPMHRHDVHDAQYINEVVDLGIGHITLSWIMEGVVV